MNPTQQQAIDSLDSLYQALAIPMNLQSQTSQDPAFSEEYRTLTRAAMASALLAIEGDKSAGEPVEQLSNALQDLNKLNLQKLNKMAQEAARAMIEIPADMLVEMVDASELPGHLSEEAIKMQEHAKVSGKNFVAAQTHEIIGRFASLGVQIIGEEKFAAMNAELLQTAPEFNSQPHRIAALLTVCAVRAFCEKSVSLEMIQATVSGVLEAAQLMRAMTTFNCILSGPSIEKKVEAMFKMHAQRTVNFNLNEATEGCDCEDCQALRAAKPAAGFDESLTAGKTVLAGSASIN